MSEQQPRTDHERFDTLCRDLGDYDALPSVSTPRPVDTADWHAGEHPEAALDDQILAGLVTPG